MNNISPRTKVFFGKYRNYMFEDIYQIDKNYCQWVINQEWGGKNFRNLQKYLNDRDYYLEEFYKNKLKCYKCQRYLTHKKTKLIQESSFDYSDKFVKELQFILLSKIKEIGLVNNIINMLCICKFCTKIHKNEKVIVIHTDKCECNCKLVWDLTNKYNAHIDSKYCLKCDKVYLSYERYPIKLLKSIL
jgi:hypothetical protein